MAASPYSFLIRLYIMLVVVSFLCYITLAWPLNSSGGNGRPKGGNIASENTNAEEVLGTDWSINEGRVSGNRRILLSGAMDYDYGEANQRHDPTIGNSISEGGRSRRPFKVGRQP